MSSLIFKTDDSPTELAKTTPEHPDPGALRRGNGPIW